MIFFNSLVVEVLILISTALVCYYIHFLKVTAKFWSERGIPHLEPKFLLGNAFTLGTTKSIAEYFEEIYVPHKEKRVLGFWVFHKPTLAIFDREIIKNILTRDFSYFQNRISFDVGDHDVLIKYNLFNMEGHAWRNMRVKMTPAFTSGKMKMMYPTMVRCGEELRDFFQDSALTGEPFELKDITSRFTTNTIATCAFGIETNALKNPDVEFRKYGMGIVTPTLLQLFTNIVFVGLFPSIGRAFKISQLPRGTTEFFVNAVKDTIEYRKLNNVQRDDFMRLLIELKEKGKILNVDKDDDADNSSNDFTVTEKDTPFTLNEAAAQAFLFFTAGFETSSLTITFALFEISKSKSIQERLRYDIKEAMNKDGGTLSYESMTKLEYLDWVVQETLRKYPPNSALMRETSKEYLLPEFDAVIPAKTLVFIPNSCLTNDHEFFPEPQTFDPLRFSPERKSEIPSTCHLPFGDGPRNCIGSRFGLLQTKVGISAILSTYTIEKCSSTPDEIKFGKKGLTLTIDGGLYFKLVKD